MMLMLGSLGRGFLDDWNIDFGGPLGRLAFPVRQANVGGLPPWLGRSVWNIKLV